MSFSAAGRLSLGLRLLAFTLICFSAQPVIGASKTDRPTLAGRILVEPVDGTITASLSFMMEARGEIAFLLDNRFKVTKALLDGQPLTYFRRNDVLIVNFGDVRGSRGLDIDYTGTLPAPDPSLAARRPGHGPQSNKDGLFLPASALWLPYREDFDFNYDLTVKAPKGYQALVPGKLVDEAETDHGYRARFQSEAPTTSLPLFAGQWDIREIKDDQGVRIRTYFDASLTDLSADYLQKSKAYIDRYRRWIGDYPFSAFHVVAGPVPVGLGYRNLTYIGSRVLKLPFIKDTSLGHEVLHNWWGNGVYTAYDEGNWNEGLTTFMADYTYALEKGDSEAREKRLQWLRDYKAMPAERDHPVRDFRSKKHGADQVIGYNKGAFIFHMLREKIGAAAFDQAIKNFWRDHQFKVARWEDIQGAMEKASDQDLAGFFRQWVDQKGAPKLVLKKAEAAGQSLTIKLAQQQGGDLSAVPEIFTLDIPVHITTTKGTESLIWTMDQGEAEKVFEAQAPITSVSIDPDFQIFRQLDVGEAPPTLRDIMLQKYVDLVVLGDGPSWGIGADKLASRLLDGQSLSISAVRTGPALVIGTMDALKPLINQGKLPSPPEAFSGQDLTAKVWSGRNAKDAAVMVVAVRDLAALEALQRPLPHYGRRGYVGFSGATAIIKGVWPATTGPLSRIIN